jgi:hypothetical protein
MSKFATRLLMLAVYALALGMAPDVPPAKAETSHSKHLKKHKKKFYRGPGLGDPWSAGRAWPDNQAWRTTAPSSQIRTCFRGFECGKWPPPFDEDPDRKASGTDQ